MRHPWKLPLAVVCLLALAFFPLLPARRGAAQTAAYTVTDVGTLTGTDGTSAGLGLDECGRVVGESIPTGSSSNHPFFSDGTTMTDLGTFGGLIGTAAAVNNAGTVTGSAHSGTSETRPFIWTPAAGKTDIGTVPPPPKAGNAAAYDINDSNQIVGQWEISPLQDRAYVWTQATGMQIITATWGTPIAAYGTNNAGQIVGTAETSTGAAHAFIRSGGVTTEIGTLGGTNSFAYEVNESGVVVGYANVPSTGASRPFHAFRWKDDDGDGVTDPGEMDDLGTLGGSRSIAYGVNASGQIVGYAEISAGVNRAFLWSDDNSNGAPDAGEMKDLNTLLPGTGWTFEEARAINDRGQIVGTGVNPSGQTHAFLLTPSNVGASPCDPPGSLQFDAATYTVGEAGTTATITVTRTGGSYGAVSVGYAISNGTAAAGSDYTATSGTLNFATDETSKTFDVTIAEDALDEPDETVNLTLSGPTGGATLGSPSAAVLTITDNDTAPSISIGDVTVTEGNSGTVNAVFNVTLAAASGQTVTVNYATADNSATQPGDYTSASGTLTFNPGDPLTKTIDVPVVGDTTDELNETFFVNLSAATNATISDNQGVGTITDDDGSPSLSVGDVIVTEGNAGTTAATFNVSLLPASGQTVTVNYAAADGTATSASGDYAATSGTLTFDPGQTSKTVTVNVNGDATPEAHETFFVNLSGAANATVSDNQGQGTVNNDDTALNINDRTLAEGNSGSTTFEFTVSLSHVTVNPVSVGYATSNGTATTAGSDYSAAGGTLNIPAGGTSGTISVQVNGDTTFEANETFNVTLSGATNAAISDNTGVGTITNDDTVPAFSINDVSVAEGNAGTTAATFNVTLSAASGLASSVNYATADNTATTAGGDYAAASGTLNFAAGETSKSITVNVAGDTLFEGNETFFVNLTSPSGATVADAQGLGTITNDEAGSVFKFDSNPSSVGEAASSVTITVTRTGSTAGGASVNYAASGGSATSGSDYTLTPGTLTFAAGETSKTFNVSILPDTLFEGNETIGLVLSSPVAGTLGTPATISLTITDANTRPTLQFSATTYTVGEAGGTATITVVRSGGSNGGATVNYATTIGGSATASSDFTATNGTLTFAADDNSETFTVAVADDALDEVNETVNLTLSSPGGGATLGANNSATLTITDNDGAPTLSVADVTTTEGQGTANFNVTLSAPSGQTVTVNYSTSNGTASAPGDYGAVTSGFVTFSPGQTTQTATVNIENDALDEPDETFNVNLSGATNATISDATGLGTITDDDPLPSIFVGDVTVIEGSGGTTSAVFNVTLTPASAKTVTVNYATADNSATQPGDYAAASGTLTFNPGDTLQTVTVAVNGDTVDESNETFFVNLSGATNATVNDGQGVGTITDDDGSPSLSVGDVIVTEGNAGTTAATFNVSLLPASGQAVSVNYATADGTATAGSDYTAVDSGTLNFAAGETSKTITVQVSGDTSNEGNETFFVNLSGAANATVSDAQGLGTIQNDDTPLFAFAQPSFPTSEGAHFVTVSVTRSGDSSGAVNVNFATSDGAATERKDYTAVSGTLRFAAGETSKSFDVLLTDDAFQELDETINLTLSNPTGGAALGTQATASVVIAADDNPPPASNPIDVSSDFVRQHYHDFLNREPDASGLAFWTGEIESCGSNAACREVKRINVSAAFFLSIEFQETGYLVYRVYKTAYGDATSPGIPGTVPVVRLNEFLPDTRRIGEGVVVGQGEWKRQLDSNKFEYFIEFTQRPRFLSEYPLSMGLTEYLNKLAQNAGVVLTGEDYERAAAYVRVGPAEMARAAVLQMIAEKEALQQQELRRAFVLMQYYGYLRRNPDDAPEPGLNFGGWNFWLGKLNEFNGDFVRAEMVKAFITSTEYRQRFGQ